MKRPFSESRHIVPGLCKSLKTAAIYKNAILEQIKAQLGKNGVQGEGGKTVDRNDAVAERDSEGEYIPIKSREPKSRSS